jgi:hypothetical protein
MGVAASRVLAAASRLSDIRLTQTGQLAFQFRLGPTRRFSQTRLNFASTAGGQDFQDLVQAFPPEQQSYTSEREISRRQM